jgi:hypothetical protein
MWTHTPETLFIRVHSRPWLELFHKYVDTCAQDFIHLSAFTAMACHARTKKLRHKTRLILHAYIRRQHDVFKKHNYIYIYIHTPKTAICAFLQTRVTQTALESRPTDMHTHTDGTYIHIHQQVVIIFVMIMGKLRGLPTHTDLGIDFSFRAVKMALTQACGSMPEYLLGDNDGTRLSFRETEYLAVSLYIICALFMCILLHSYA